MNRRLEKLEERWGHRYLYFTLGIACLIAAATTVGNVVILGIAGSIPGGRLLSLHLAALGASAPGVLVVIAWRWKKVLRPVLDWKMAGEPAAGSAETLRRIIALPLAIVPPTAVVIMIFEIPVFLWGISLSTVDISLVVVFVGVSEAVAGGALLIYLVMELMLRPVARRAQRASEESGLVAPGNAPSLRNKLLIGLPIVNVMSAYVAVVLSANTADISERFTVGFAAALMVTLTVSLVLTATLTRSLSEPVDELVDAAGRVARGDLTAVVHPLAGDELGILATRFNEMVAGLRERESLRETNVGLVDELQASRARIVTAADAERQAVERDLHDGAQQHLVLLRLKLGLIQKQLERGEDPTASVTDAGAELERALDELRDLAHGIYPQVLTSDGLGGALRDAAGRAPIPTSLKSGEVRRYQPEVEAAVYFCCLEALQNAGKHAADANAVVSLREGDGKLHFEIADDGPGFDPGEVNGSAGLQNMADRIGALGGELSIDSGPGRGTRVSGTVPVSG